MAGDTFELRIEPHDALWLLVRDFAQSVPSKSWVLVGGLMVQAHALRAKIDVTRQTTDIDALLNLTIASIAEIAGPIQEMGFTPHSPEFGGPFHRFTRGGETIDVMVGRDVRHTVRWAGKEVLRSPGAAQAILRADKYVLRAGSSPVFSIFVPDSVGAVIAKSAAHQIDRRDRERHLIDLVSLLASAPRGAFHAEAFSKKDISYLRHVASELENKSQGPWLFLSEIDRVRAMNAFDEMRSTL